MTSTLELFKNLMTFSILKRELIAIDVKHVTFSGCPVWECCHLYVARAELRNCRARANIGERCEQKWVPKGPRHQAHCLISPLALTYNSTKRPLIWPEICSKSHINAGCFLKCDFFFFKVRWKILKSSILLLMCNLFVWYQAKYAAISSPLFWGWELLIMFLLLSYSKENKNSEL